MFFHAASRNDGRGSLRDGQYAKEVSQREEARRHEAEADVTCREQDRVDGDEAPPS
jgi:hypothetical protein